MITVKLHSPHAIEFGMSSLNPDHKAWVLRQEGWPLSVHETKELAERALAKLMRPLQTEGMTKVVLRGGTKVCNQPATGYLIVWLGEHESFVHYDGQILRHQAVMVEEIGTANRLADETDEELAWRVCAMAQN